MVSQSLTIVSKTTIFPTKKSTLPKLKLSVSDLPMLSCHYIQKGCLFTEPPVSIHELVSALKVSLSETLTHFPPLAGRLATDMEGHVHIACNDEGVDFIVADGSHFNVDELMAGDEANGDLPGTFKGFFTLDRTVSYQGHFRPILAVQVTELADGVFIGFAVNHAVCDGTSFWNFFNSFAEVCRGVKVLSRVPDFTRDSILISPAVLRLPEGGPTVTFGDAPVRERIIRFSRESILKLKNRVNNNSNKLVTNYYYNKDDDNSNIINDEYGGINVAELMGKMSNDTWRSNTKPPNHHDSNHKTTRINYNNNNEISSFQSLCALLWRAVTRARNLPPTKTTTFRMAVNCRHRLEPKLSPTYFGNAIQSIPTFATADDVLNNDIAWCARELNKNVTAHDQNTVRKYVESWERDPRCFPLGNFDGAMLTMGSSPRFPMYENDLGWGKPVAVRSGRANKFDGKISAFPSRFGDGSVELEVVLAPETMEGILADEEFMQYVDDKYCYRC